MRSIILRSAVCLLFAAIASSAAAQNDRVRTMTGTLSGEVTAMNAATVTVKRGSTTKEAPVSQIESVQFAGEPSELTQARVNARNGGYAVAVEKLAKIDAGRIENPFVRQDIEFYRAFCQAKLALLGEGDVTDAGRQLNTFTRKNAKNYHYLQAKELLGDLLVSAGRYGPAEKMYGELARAPWPAYQARAGVLIGRVLQAQDKHAEALDRFEAALSALASTEDSPEAKSQRLAAELGKAVSLSATGRVDEGVSLVDGVLRDADPSEDPLLASAYNALGACHLQAGKTKDALFAYLHVDLLFANEPEAHAEALYHLATLWEEIGKPQQAREARRTLEERYAATTWAKR